MDYHGSCHCGAITLVLRSAKPATVLGARKCGCSFCLMQGAAWTSDPEGQLEVSVGGPLTRYRFGTKTADFLVCGQCGVVPVVICEIGEQLLGVLRVNCLEDSDTFFGQCQLADYDGEALDDRLTRRANCWTPLVIKEMA
jgi:hypothetical protein